MSCILTSARQTDNLHVLVSDAQASLKLSAICPIKARPGLFKVRSQLYALWEPCQGIVPNQFGLSRELAATFATSRQIIRRLSWLSRGKRSSCARKSCQIAKGRAER